MNILIVNDDGYTSDGIKILQNALRDYGNIVVVAPHLEQSAKSSSITIRGGLKVHNHGENLYSVEGTPSDCISFALNGLKLKVDLVVSGINFGYNLGYDTIYSGTVGAGMEALLNGTPSVAFSSDLDDFQNAKKEIKRTLDYIFKHELISSEYLLNINFQIGKFTTAKDILITDLGTRKFEIKFEEIDGHYYSKREFFAIDEEVITDISAVHQGYISITPLRLGNGDHSLVKKLKQKVE